MHVQPDFLSGEQYIIAGYETAITILIRTEAEAGTKTHEKRNCSLIVNQFPDVKTEGVKDLLIEKAPFLRIWKKRDFLPVYSSTSASPPGASSVNGYTGIFLIIQYIKTRAKTATRKRILIL